jgi:hypothetical protein
MLVRVGILWVLYAGGRGRWGEFLLGVCVRFAWRKYVDAKTRRILLSNAGVTWIQSGWHICEPRFPANI